VAILDVRCPFWAYVYTKALIIHGSQPIFVWKLGKNSIFNIFSILNYYSISISIRPHTDIEY